MRLLNTATLEFGEFFAGLIPEYAILSHRWGDYEVSYKQFRKALVPQDSPGLVKIQRFCQLAAERGFQWAWIDTCCVDKRSSAELSEAINSMYKWYRSSRECYVCLSDVEFSSSELSLLKSFKETFWDMEECSNFRDRFRKSSWFTRGWTLQELIAPTTVIFYDTHWNEIGPLEHVRMDVAEATQIAADWIGPQDTRRLWKASVATRMSWASCRATTLEEDMAYCLLGLFNVNMPLLYGEGGKKAFYRLQVEIMKVSDDESLFAWRASNVWFSGLLAVRPSYFMGSGDIDGQILQRHKSRPPYYMTNKGLEIAIPLKHLWPAQGVMNRGRLRFFLRCSRTSTQKTSTTGTLYEPFEKALYVDLFLDDYTSPFLKSAIRVDCGILGGDESEYLVHDLNLDLQKYEKIHIHPPSF